MVRLLARLAAYKNSQKTPLFAPILAHFERNDFVKSCPKTAMRPTDCPKNAQNPGWHTQYLLYPAIFSHFPESFLVVW
jgi:hypothetical protein